MFANATMVLILMLCFGIAVCFSTALIAPAGDVHELTLLHALYWFPSLFYLWVLMAIRRTFLDIAPGRCSDPPSSEACGTSAGA